MDTDSTPTSPIAPQTTTPRPPARVDVDAQPTKKARTGDSGKAIATSDKASNLCGSKQACYLTLYAQSADREQSQRKEPARRPPALVGPQPFRYIAPLPTRRVTLPQNEMSLPLQIYDPADFTNLPTATSENPHTKLTRRDDQPALPILTFTPFANSAFKAASIPEYKLRGNIAEEQLKAMDALGERVLYIVFHGGGMRLIKRAPEKLLEVRELMEILRFECHGEGKPILDVIAPIAKNPSDRKRFGQPWTLFLILGKDEDALRKYLLWQQVFSVHPTLSFSVHAAIPGQPWTVMVLTGASGAVSESDDAVKQVLTAIKTVLWANVDFCVFAAKMVAKHWGASGNMAELAKLATDSLDLTCVRAELSGSEKLVPAYLIYAKPPTTDRAEYQSWVGYFTAPGVYWRDFHQLKVNDAIVDCKLCKEASHCACDCPLAKSPGWQGPTAKDIYQSEQENLTHVPATSAPTQQAAELWRQVPKKGDKPRKGEKGRGSKKGSSAGKKDSRPPRR